MFPTGTPLPISTEAGIFALKSAIFDFNIVYEYSYCLRLSVFN